MCHDEYEHNKHEGNLEANSSGENIGGIKKR